mmetsp:Transcript_18120/g.41920  ORF Transcript_18120/g.41920 Transcript_18120/m.41920 type:complete len:130 (+) Transcript_18120:1352-1741(+)
MRASTIAVHCCGMTRGIPNARSSNSASFGSRWLWIESMPTARHMWQQGLAGFDAEMALGGFGRQFAVVYQVYQHHYGVWAQVLYCLIAFVRLHQASRDRNQCILRDSDPDVSSTRFRTVARDCIFAHFG